MCKNILISTKGSIRISEVISQFTDIYWRRAAGQECCQELVLSQGSIRDIRGVGYITIDLVDKDVKYEGPIKVCDTCLWSNKAVQFLSRTESAYSINKLIEVNKTLPF